MFRYAFCLLPIKQQQQFSYFFKSFSFEFRQIKRCYFHAGIRVAHEIDIVVDSPPIKDVDGKTAIIPTADGGYVEVDVEEAMTQKQDYFDINADVRFELYTRRNPEIPYVINMSDPESIRHSPFNSKHPTRIAVHGWRSVGEMFELLVDGKFQLPNYSC